MTTAQSAYRLQKILDNPLFEGFAFEDNTSIRGKDNASADFFPDNMRSARRQAPRLASIWKPRKVIGRVRSMNDFPRILSIPAFSRKAVDALRDLLEPNGEILPLVSEVGEYYAFNVTTLADCLDIEASTIEWESKKQRLAVDITRYEFRPSMVENLTIFRLLEQPNSTFVTDVFEQRVREHHLQGFVFSKLWPLPPGVYWRDEEKRQWKENQRIKPAKSASQSSRETSKPIKGNTLVVRLILNGKRPSKKEAADLARVQDYLDALLLSGNSEDYFGNLEGCDTLERECRLFISCPDADELFEAKKSALRRIPWNGDRYFLKRYGEYTDTSAREKYVE